MVPTKVLLSLLQLTLSARVIHASPLTRETGKATLRLTTNINSAGFSNIAEKDRARAQALTQASHLGRRDGSFNITNAQVSYTAQVGIGTPATEYTLLIDTGGANTWVGAGKPFVPTSSSVDTGDPFNANGVSGEEWIDTVTLSPNLVISRQSFGVAKTVNGYSGVDGVLGLGPVSLTQGTVSNTFEVPTVSDNLYAQGTISQEVVSIFFTPYSQSNTNGELTFGGYDSSVLTSSVNYVPLTTTSPASYYWGIDQSISYGTSTILPSTAGIIDTGTTLLLIASDAYQTYQSLTGATLDSITGLLTITTSQYANLQDLTFNIGGVSYTLTPNGQIWPRSLNTAIGGSSSAIYLIVNDIGSPSGSGLDFINGYAFLERFYTVIDVTNGRIGVAETIYTTATTN